MSRRLNIFPAILLALLGLSAAPESLAFTVETVMRVDTPQAQYARRRLLATFAMPEIAQSRSGARVVLELAVDAKIGAEAFSIRSRNRRVAITGGDARGLVYGALEVRAQLLNGVPIEKLAANPKPPRLAFRGIKFNTPWDSYRPSTALDQHTATVRDLAYWESFLDMMVENRFNAVSLWTMHPFTYMIRPRHFPEASKWSDAEFAAWQRLYREIFRMAKERGLDTYVVFWSIFVSEEFAKAHGVASKNFYPHYYVPGDTSEVTKRYLRESVTQMLEEYRDLDGIGVSHGEGMAGMTPLERQRFVDEVYVAGALDARRTRPVKLIHRVPFSSGLDSGPGVSTDVEKITRAAMERLGDRFSGPIWAEMKFNWSHGHSTPKLVKVHGGKLGDTYFRPAPSNYRVVWQVRNEDFFALRWGVPDFIRAHIAQNGNLDGTQPHVGGYFIGSETYIPALDYFTEPPSGGTTGWKWAFERQWLYYALWGRLLYDPATPDAVFTREFTRRYGPGAANLLRAFSLASNTQMRLASLYDSRWDFTLYGEGFLALQGEITRYIGVDALIAQPTLDPAYISVADFVKSLGKAPLPADAMTPPRLADLLERDCREALHLVGKMDAGDDVALAYEIADVGAWANLGLHLAEKLRGAVAIQRFRSNPDAAQRAAAIEHLAKSLAHWDEVIRITRPLYRDMKLTHYNHNSFDSNPDNLFHWAKIRDEVAQDVAVARGLTLP